jgi:hypothetical protein
MITNYKNHLSPKSGDKVVIIRVNDYDNKFVGRTAKIICEGVNTWPAWYKVSITGHGEDVWLCWRQFLNIDLIRPKKIIKAN